MIWSRPERAEPAAALPRSAPAAKRPRLLFVVNDSAFFVSHRLPIGRAAVAEGYDVHLCALDAGRLDEIAAAGIAFHPLTIDRAGTNPLADLRTLLHLGRVIARLRPDIIHAVTIKAILYSGLLSRVQRVPGFVAAFVGGTAAAAALGTDTIGGEGFATHSQLVPPGFYRRASRLAYRVVLGHPNLRVIFQNEDSRREFVAAGMIAPDRTVLTRGSGVDLEVFRPTPEPPGPPVVVLPSRLIWEKGVGVFAEAAARLRPRFPEARFALVGDPPEHRRGAVPRAQIEAWVVDGTLEWWGYRPDMAEVLASAHVVCLPSHYLEGLPKVLLEAAAAGRPIVTTDMPGCREVVQDGVEGRLVPIRDPGAVAEALAPLLDDPALRRRMGAAARRRAERDFWVGDVVEKTLGIYRSLTATASAPQP